MKNTSTELMISGNSIQNGGTKHLIKYYGELACIDDVRLTLVQNITGSIGQALTKFSFLRKPKALLVQNLAGSFVTKFQTNACLGKETAANDNF